jgi:hypothetical protein
MMDRAGLGTIAGWFKAYRIQCVPALGEARWILLFLAPSGGQLRLSQKREALISAS